MFLGVAVALLGISLSVESANVPDYFQTEPELYPGPTATGRAPLLAEINPEFVGPDGSFVPNTPLQTAEPIKGDTDGTNIFRLQGQIAPYFPNPRGFGVKEYPLPSGSKISQVHTIHRHGTRYPSKDAAAEKFGRGLSQAIKDGAKFSGELSFLNNWSYELGEEILVPVGRQEMFDSGVLHYYDYGHLYKPGSKIIVRTTTQDRILKSAEDFLAGFFGLDYTKNATIEIIIEADGFNNTLGGNLACPNANLPVSAGGTNASVIWENKYLAPAVKRFQALSENFKWNISDAYGAQLLCNYETVSYGFSSFCDLFSLTEWKGFEYSWDLIFAGNYMFQSPVGRAVGIGYVDEFLARLEHHYISTSDHTQVNTTLDNNPTTFPLDQTLYFDISHVSTITSVLTAFGLTQFAQFLPTSGPPPDQQLIASYVNPLGGRLDIEIISAPHPVAEHRSSGKDSYGEYHAGGPTKYVHFILNQRTVPLGVSLPACGNRDDGWCEYQTFLKTQRDAVKKAEFDYACYGKYPPVPYGTLKDGVPQPK